jgi:hypothetical protein
VADIFAEVTAVGIQGLSGGGAGGYGATGSTGPQGDPGATGPQGASGVAGATGSSISIVGTVADSSYLPDPYTGNAGDGYITDDTGHLWVWNGTTWTDVGEIKGPTGATGSTGPQGPQGDTGLTGATGTQGASGIQGNQGASGIIGLNGATGIQGIQGASGVGASGAQGLQGATGIQGVQGASGISGASGYVGSDGATGLTGATGAGVVQSVFTTSSTNQVVIETIDPSLYRSAKYEMQLTSSSSFQATELRLLIDLPNVYLTQYGSIGETLGDFESYYSPLTSDYFSPNINSGGMSYWNGTDVRVYTTNTTVILGLLSAPSGTVFTLNGGAASFTSSGMFTEISTGVYGVSATSSRSPSLLISRIVWAGTGNVELRFTPDYSITTLKYLRTIIDV